MLPKISNYGKCSSDNYGAHTLKVDLGEIEFYYSYTTIIAYADGKDGLVVSKNYWGVTTGKHLNFINDDKKSRKEADTFEKMLKAAIERHLV